MGTESSRQPGLLKFIIFVNIKKVMDIKMKPEQPHIDIPVIEIAPNWTVEDLKTLDDCDDAFSYLTGAICSIEHTLAFLEESKQTGDQYRRAKGALRWKKAALQITNPKRSQISRAITEKFRETTERELIDTMKKMFPLEFQKVLETLKTDLIKHIITSSNIL